MKLSGLVSVVAGAAILAGCATPSSLLKEIEVPSQRMTQKGYALTTPNENGWLIARRNVHQLDLVRRGAHPDESLAIQAAPVKLPKISSTDEFVRLVKGEQSSGSSPVRFSMKRHDVEPYLRKGNCVLAHLLAEDNAPVKRSKREGVMILEALSLTCIHPKNNAVGISVTYSHRHYPGNEDPAFERKAMAVLDGLEFGEL